MDFVAIQEHPTPLQMQTQDKIYVQDRHGSIYSLAILIPYGSGCLVLCLFEESCLICCPGLELVLKADL